LLENPGRMNRLKDQAAKMAHPESALQTARLLLDLADRFTARTP